MPDKDIPELSDLTQAPLNPPKTLMLMLMQQYGIGHFVETGTHHGKTSLWAAGYFQHVTTIEAQQALYEQTSQRLADVRNIRFVLGNSAERLAEIAATLKGRALFWLDAHWMGTSFTFGNKDECPLLAEIEAIGPDSEHFIFIDDARLFLSPPPSPLSAPMWPTIDAVSGALARSGRYTVVFYDTIISVPAFAREFTAAYCQKVTTLALAESERRKWRFRWWWRGRRTLARMIQGLRPVASR